MPSGFHPDPHFFPAHLELAVELLRFLAVPQFPLVPFPTVRIDKRNLLEARVLVTTYNDHVRLLSPEPWLVSATKVYSGVGADIVMESLHQLCGCFRNPLNAMASKNVLTSLIIRAKRAQVAQSVPAMLPMRL